MPSNPSQTLLKNPFSNRGSASLNFLDIITELIYTMKATKTQRKGTKNENKFKKPDRSNCECNRKGYAYYAENLSGFFYL